MCFLDRSTSRRIALCSASAETPRAAARSLSASTHGWSKNDSSLITQLAESDALRQSTQANFDQWAEGLRANLNPSADRERED